MNKSLAFLAAATLSIASAEETNVLNLNSENYESTLAASGENPVLVKYFVPWCQACEYFNPMYSDAADLLLTSNPKLKLTEVDCSIEKEICEKANVIAYPSLIYYNGEKVLPYKSDRTTEGVVSFVETVNAAAYKAFDYGSEALNYLRDAAAKNPNPSFLLCTKSVKDVPASFIDFAERHYSNGGFGTVVGATACATAGGKAPNPISVAMIAKDGADLELSADLPDWKNQKAVDRWFLANTMPLVTVLNAHNLDDVILTGERIAVVATDPTALESTKEQLASVARTFRNDFLFAVVDRRLLSNNADAFGFDADLPYPQVSILEGEAGYFSDHGVLTLNNIEAGLKSVINGKISKSIADVAEKSEFVGDFSEYVNMIYKFANESTVNMGICATSVFVVFMVAVMTLSKILSACFGSKKTAVKGKKNLKENEVVTSAAKDASDDEKTLRKRK